MLEFILFLMLSFISKPQQRNSISGMLARQFATNAKSEKEKMLAGEFYYARDPQLMKEKTRVRYLIDKYNITTAVQMEERKRLLNEIFQNETDAYIETPFHVDYGTNIKMGK